MPIARLWVNGRAVQAEGATLALGRGGLVWWVEAGLPSHSPFLQEFGLSMELADGRTAHGRARLTAADGAHVTFEGTDGLHGAAVPP